ncbi:MAG: hypothetical protein MJ051_03475 [Akkermansia sp.]|nr:hypothetical protein [Akkermansia sp.]
MKPHLSTSLILSSIGLCIISAYASAASPEYSNGDASFSGTQITIGDLAQKNYNNYNELTFYSFYNQGSDTSGVEAHGGAFVISAGQLSINDNGNTTFENNTVTSPRNHGKGGAIFCYSYQSIIDVFKNDVIAFTNNQVKASLPQGGAIYGGKINLHDNGQVIFSDNQTKSYYTSTKYYKGIGGAICLYESNSATFSNNESVTFQNNRSAQGGAVYARRDSRLKIQNNDSVSFVGNIVHEETNSNVKGAAIYGRDSTIDISNNNSVIFRNNAQIADDSIVLRSIYLEAVEQGYGTPALTLTANTGGEIMFYDSIYIGKNVPIVLNKDASGAIIFTGESTMDDFRNLFTTYAVPDTATPDYEASRTSELLGTTTLYGGRVIVKEKAVLNISNLNVRGGEVIVASEAQLNLANKNITMPSLTLAGGTVTLGTEDNHTAALTTSDLTVTDNSTLNADLIIADNGSITFDFGGSDEKKLTMGCAVTLGNDYKVYLDHATITMLMGYENAEGITLMNDIENIRDILLADNVRIYDTDTNEESDILLYTQTESNGTMSLKAVKATPEPATATLSLLALAALAARRKRK